MIKIINKLCNDCTKKVIEHIDKYVYSNKTFKDFCIDPKVIWHCDVCGDVDSTLYVERDMVDEIILKTEVKRVCTNCDKQTVNFIKDKWIVISDIISDKKFWYRLSIPVGFFCCVECFEKYLESGKVAICVIQCPYCFGTNITHIKENDCKRLNSRNIIFKCKDCGKFLRS